MSKTCFEERPILSGLDCLKSRIGTKVMFRWSALFWSVNIWCYCPAWTNAKTPSSPGATSRWRFLQQQLRQNELARVDWQRKDTPCCWRTSRESVSLRTIVWLSHKCFQRSPAEHSTFIFTLATLTYLTPGQAEMCSSFRSVRERIPQQLDAGKEKKFGFERRDLYWLMI